jgi:hypothetical protein
VSMPIRTAGASGVGPQLQRILAEVARLARPAAPLIEATALGFAERVVRKPLVFDGETRRRAHLVLPTLHKALRTSDWARFARAQARLPFLAAAHTLLRSKPNELVVVGIGTWKGNRSFIREVFVREGHKASVGLPVSVQATMKGHIEEMQDAELLHVHNHPQGEHRDRKNAMVGRSPTPSIADRRVLVDHIQVVAEANEGGGCRRVRFHLVENDLIHEYVLPPWEILRPYVEELFRSFTTRT